MQGTTDITDIKQMAVNVACDRFSPEGWARTSVQVPRETALTIRVNGRPLITIICTAIKLDCLVLGYLYAEGIISSIHDVEGIHINEEELIADVKLSDTDYELPVLRTLGCSGGSVFNTGGLKVDSDTTTTPADVLSLMKMLEDNMNLYQLSGGVHTSALCDVRNLLIIAEDIGRHNTLNKIQGECLLKGISTKGLLLLITGRISSEMLLKAVKMQVPIVISRHSPTESAISLARGLDITLVGEVRGGKDSLSVFCHPERLGFSTN